MKDNHNHKILGVAEPTHLGQHGHQFALISNTCRYVGGNHLHEVVFTTSTSTSGHAIRSIEALPMMWGSPYSCRIGSSFSSRRPASACRSVIW